MTTLPRLLLALLLAVSAARAADTGTLTRAESLRARPLAITDCP